MTSRQSNRMVAKRTKQSGFTLIELIMVIVILGILSAFALPKFADLSGSAEIATVEGVRAALRSGAAIAHAQFLANGSTGTTVTIEGDVIDIVEGYPAQTDLADLLELDDYTVVEATTTGYTIISVGTADNDSCVAYTSAVANATPTISAVGTLTNGGTDLLDTCT